MTNDTDKQPSLVERKLVTILSADVAEFSRLMSEDEEGTLLTFRDYSKTFIALVEMHHGRIFNTAGDALLAEFSSPIEAVRCATDIQAALRTRNDLLPPAKQVHFRIGVNLGDVMTQGSDLLGDGVNVAARLQGAAEPGGICISGTVYDQIRNKLSLNIETLGERRFKNIAQPVRTFTIAATGDDDVASPARRKPAASRAPQPKASVPGAPRAPMPKGLLVAVTVAGIALLAAAGGYWAFTKLPRSTAAQTTSQTKVADSASTPNPSAPTKAPIALSSLDKEASALLADAQRLKRPQKEIDTLTAANTQIAALASQLHGLGKKPGDDAKSRALVAQMNSIAAGMAHDEATALDRAATQMSRGLDKAPAKSVPSSARAALVTAQQAKATLETAIDDTQKATDGSASLKAASTVLADYSAFDSAYDAAAPALVAARRNDLQAAITAARSVSESVIAYSRVKKPWLLASRARKDAYQTLSTNASEAQSQVAQLDALSQRASSATSISKVDAAVSQAATIKASLNRLLQSSAAAYATFNQ